MGGKQGVVWGQGTLRVASGEAGSLSVGLNVQHAGCDNQIQNLIPL